jgi:hypothetical protein
MSPTTLPRPQRTLRLYDRQRASRKLGLHSFALLSPCAHHVPHYTTQAAAYATFARLSTRIMEAERAFSHLMLVLCESCPQLYYPGAACIYLVLALCASFPPLNYPGAACGGRGVRYARTIVNAHHVSQARMLPPYACLVRIMPPLYCPGTCPPIYCLGATRGGRSVR